MTKNFPKDPDRDYSISNAEISIATALWDKEVYGLQQQKMFYQLITTADFYFSDINLAIFIDGEQVHKDKALEDMVMDDDDSTIKYRLNEYDGAFLISTKSVMTVEEIQQALMTDPDAGFAVIDYLGLIRSEGRSLYESVSKVARALKGVAKETNTAIMCLCQTRRIDKFTPVTLEMGRDTGVIEEGTDYLIGLWRDSPENAVIVAELLKNRRGKDSIRDHMIIRNHKLVAALVTEGDEGGSSNSGD